MPSVIAPAEQRELLDLSQPTVNDVVIKVATPNGSGSQSANLILLRSIFRMGIPVSGKNLFPSNIQGLPTWFTIRANKHGWVAQRRSADVLIAMNPDTVSADIAELRSGSILLVSDALKAHVKRNDLRVYFAPFPKMAAEVCPDTRLRKMVANILYVGVTAWLLGIDLEEVVKSIEEQFRAKPKAAELNTNAVRRAYEWARDNLEPQEWRRLERDNQTAGQILIEGNEAAAIGLLFGGATFCSWYPITPSSGLVEALTYYLEKYRVEPETGRKTFAVVQAEDELASIAMVVGAGWAGARAVTATAGPGLSLMAELAGFAYFAEIPAVIVDVQRMGPSTGLPTRTSQGDMAKAYQLSHGDCKHVLLIPGSVKECFEFGGLALDLAERLQTLVLVMSDLDLGMNPWISAPFEMPAEPLDRGKILTAEDLDKVTQFARYRDVDGDGICYRTLPYTDHEKAAYFTRGTGHTEEGVYSENPANWRCGMERLARKFDTARGLVPQPVVDLVPGAAVGLIGYGSSDPAIAEARHYLDRTHDIPTSYMRLRALPLNGVAREFIEAHERVYVVEQNRDGQVAGIIRDEYPPLAPRIRSALHYNGLPLDAETVVEQIAAREAAESGKSPS